LNVPESKAALRAAPTIMPSPSESPTMLSRAGAFLFLLAVAASITLPERAEAQRASAPGPSLQPGDRVAIKFLMDSTFADVLRIDDGGRIVLPRIGPMQVVPLDPAAIGDSVRRAYARHVNVVAVEVVPLRRVTVIGEVHRPGFHYLEPQAAIRDAIASAGGITALGVPRRVTLMRNGENLDVGDWLVRTGDAYLMQSGDVVMVHRESWLMRNAFTVVSAASVLVSITLALTR
jgi:protein involved in polysaccharide export with SLBB domain